MTPALALPPSLAPVLPAPRHTLPLHGSEASRAAERAAADVLAPHTLMQRAGIAVARLALALAPHAERIHVVCGPGNNGGDGLVAATWLHAAGVPVCVTFAGDAARLPADAAAAWRQAMASGVCIQAEAHGMGEASLVIDALLGLGARRAPEGRIAQLIRDINTSSALVLAVDLPSGLHPDTGQTLGECAVRAHHTVSLLTLKPGLFTGEGRDFAGRVWIDPLTDHPLPPPTAWLCGADVVRSLAPPRRHAQHKGSFGNVLVIGGAPGMTGAAQLCAVAALGAGAGRVYADALGGAPNGGDPGVMWRIGAGRDPSLLSQCTVVCGCGGGDVVSAVLPAVLAHSPRLVLDADALNAIARGGALAEALRARAQRGQPTLLTPHPLEAARLLGRHVDEVQAERLASAQVLAERLQAHVLLKGAGTVITGPGLTPWINPTGNAALATAGTGDVLAGWVAGLWAAAGASGGPNALPAALAGAWLHGSAADHWVAQGGSGPLLASRLIDLLTQRQPQRFAANG